MRGSVSSDYETVTIGWDADHATPTVDRDSVVIGDPQAGRKANLRFVVSDSPPNAARVEVEFERYTPPKGGGASPKSLKCPFDSFGLELGSQPPAFVGAGNNRIRGSYKYGIEFFDASDQRIGSRLDPDVKNEDWP